MCKQWERLQVYFVNKLSLCLIIEKFGNNLCFDFPDLLGSYSKVLWKRVNFLACIAICNAYFFLRWKQRDEMKVRPLRTPDGPVWPVGNLKRNFMSAVEDKDMKHHWFSYFFKWDLRPKRNWSSQGHSQTGTWIYVLETTVFLTHCLMTLIPFHTDQFINLPLFNIHPLLKISQKYLSKEGKKHQESMPFCISL